MDFALTFPEERSAQDAANVAATLKQAGWRVDQGELEKAVGFTLEREESTPSQPPFGLAKAKTAFKNAENAFKNARSDLDAQGDLPAKDALVEALRGRFEKSLAKAAAEELKKENADNED